MVINYLRSSLFSTFRTLLAQNFLRPKLLWKGDISMNALVTYIFVDEYAK